MLKTTYLEISEMLEICRKYYNLGSRYFVLILLLGLAYNFLHIESCFSLENNNPKTLIHEWAFNNSQFPAGVSCYSSDKTNELNASVVEHGGKTALAVSFPKGTPAQNHSKYINFNYDTNIVAGSEYLIELYVKGSVKGEIGLRAITVSSPWSNLGDKSSKKIIVEPNWKKVELKFVASKNYKGWVRMPLIVANNYPEGATLYLAAVKISKLKSFIPYALNKEWALFPAVRQDIDLEKLKSVPEILPGKNGSDVKALNINIKNNLCDIEGIIGYAKNKEVAILFNTFESPEDATMQLGSSADWWFECYINGQKVFSTIETGGNFSRNFKPEDHVFNIPVKKGTNLLAVKVLSGMDGWKFSCGPVKYQQSTDTLYPIKEGSEWKAINMKDKWDDSGTRQRTKMNNLLVKKGTALDLSRFCDAPAGKYGRVIMNENGRLAFEDKPDISVRFRSFNMSMTWTSWFFRLTMDEIKEFAEAISRRGYNMVRPVNLNIYIMGYGVVPGTKKTGKQNISKPKLPQTVDDFNQAIDIEAMDRFDYFSYCLKQRGVYLDLTMGGGWYSPIAVINGKKSGSIHDEIYFREDLKNNWVNGIKYLLTHVNPYTKQNLLQSNQIVNFTFVNEQDIRESSYPAFTPYWKEFIKGKYQNTTTLSKAWGLDKPMDFKDIPEISNKLLHSGTTAGIDAIHFLEDIMCKLTKFHYQKLREIGYRGLFSHWDMYMRLLEVPPRSLVTLTSMHTYHDHVSYEKPLSSKYVQKNYAYGWWKGTERVFNQQSSITHNGASYFRRVAATRFLDRPFIINEFGHGSYNRYHHEQGLVFGAYAALQQWDSLGVHNNVVNLYPNASPFFNSPIDPVSRASELVSAFAWMRGDVKSSVHSIEYMIKPEMVYSKDCLKAIGSEYTKIALLTKIGNSYPQKALESTAKITPDIRIVPKEFTRTAGTGYFAVTKDALSKGDITKEIVDKLRKKGILKTENITNVNKNIYQSDTEEILLNIDKGTMSVVTPRLEGAIVKENKSVILKQLEIKECSTPASVTVVSLEDQKKLDKASRLLLIFSTHAVGKNTVFASRKQNRLIEPGTFPMLMKTGALVVNLKTDQHNKPKVYALNLDGTRECEIPISFSEGLLSLSLNTSNLKFATPYFEIIY